MNRLIIFKALTESSILNSFLAKDYDQLTHLLSCRLLEQPLPAPVFAAFVLEELLALEGLFGAAACKPSPMPASLREGAIQEVSLIQQALAAYEEPAWLNDSGFIAGKQGHRAFFVQQFFGDWQNQNPALVVDKLIAFHRQNGYGFLVKHRIWRWEGRLVGASNPDSVELADLIGYEDQKQQLLSNTKAFLQQNRGNNVLLYGQRGTGKSSLVKATANHFAEEGLSLIEVPRGYLLDLPKIIQLLKHQPRHYVLFVDDLSFDQADKDYKELKGVLEGGVENIPKNILLYATSNRRHLVYESWEDRTTTHSQRGELRLGDTLSEKLSLGDRFGLTITFATPDQEEYLAIVQGIAKRENLALDPDILQAESLKWARWQNSPSGRTARQFINSLTDCSK